MRSRQGFTLVEMLVTLALVLFIMVILSEAFGAGLGTFRQLKAVGDMQEKLRSVAIILRHDLQNHYLQNGSQPPTPPPNTSLWLDNTQFGPPPQTPAGGTGLTFTPPTLGFFRIEQLDAPPPGGTGTNYVNEGTDPQGLASMRSAGTSTGSHRLYFTIRIPQTVNGQRRENYLSGTVPSGKLDALGPADYQATGVYNSQSAEVAYFLRSLVPTFGAAGQTPGATQSNPNGTATPLFALYRRQLLLMDGTTTDWSAANGAPTQAVTLIPSYYDISCRPNSPANTALAFNSLFDVAPMSANGDNKRCLTLSNPTGSGSSNFSVVPSPPGPFDQTTTSPPQFPYPKLGDRGESATVQGDDLLLTNVVSFTVRVLPAGGYDFVDLNGLPGISTTAPFVYDTGLIGTPSGPNFRIAALEITIRVWDVKTQQTRQTTIIQDMGGLNSPSLP